MTDDEVGPSNEQPRCTLCQVTLLQETVLKSMWKNRNTRNIRCNDCRRPKCTAIQCQTCKICRDETCKSQTCTKSIKTVPSESLPETLEERDSWLCSKCRTHRCSLCEKMLPQTAFPAQMWNHRLSRNAFCNDCCRPKCTWKNCKTCTNCRWEDCPKRKKCTAITSLNPQQIPRTLEERDTWLCLHCRYIVCQTCKKKELPKKRQQSVRNSDQKQLWTCGDCLTLEESKKVFRKYT